MKTHLSAILLTLLALSTAILIATPNSLVQAAIVRNFNLIVGQKIKVKCPQGYLSMNRISDTEWEITCQSRTVTPTPIPPTPTIIPPSPTPHSMPTTIPTVVPTSNSMQTWHAPKSHDNLNVHEHGDAPPEWANQFSQKHFGHPVIFGGDEATPNENMMKHQAYKGFLMTAANTGGTDVFIRYHSMSNPHDRSFPLHSYEVYAKDKSGNVSFWQGWNFYGYSELKNQRMTRRHEVPGTDGFPGRDQFIIASPDKTDWDNFLRCEQWYGHGGLWAWDVSTTICGATTFFKYDEHLTDYANPATWDKTGSLGATRRLEISHYGPQNSLVSGENLPFDKWFCAKLRPNENRAEGTIPTWDLTGAVSGPKSCPDGFIPQYIADTFPKAGIYFQTGNTQEKTFPTTNVTLPN